MFTCIDTTIKVLVALAGAKKLGSLRELCSFARSVETDDSQEAQSDAGNETRVAFCIVVVLRRLGVERMYTIGRDALGEIPGPAKYY
mmetsp:Transcript_26989/g.67737  ORF Transcript_26989/g.67737 Transcript_26989/m.67737 type:complete len:87 (+) Transcript_26989:117-377(+)